MLTIVKKNDSYDAITYQLENEDNSTVDLTGASVNFVMGKKNKLITNAKATVTSATSGIVSYQLTPSDTLVSGTFLAEFVVTFANGTVKTYPSNGYITVDVEQNLDTSQANVVIDMIAEKQGDFTSKLNSILLQAGNINMSAMNEYSWTATEGQLIFIFPSSVNYTPSTKWFQVSVGNVPVDNTLVNRSYDNQFALNIDSSNIKTGMTVRAMWVEPITPVVPNSYKIIPQQDLPPVDAGEGDLWFDTSDNTYQGTVFDALNSQLVDKAKKVWYDVTAYGAKGDGITDDTVSFQNALSDIQAKNGGVLFIPSGNYVITATLNLNKNTEIRGTGYFSKILVNNGKTVFKTTSMGQVKIKDLYIADTSSTRAEYTIWFSHCYNCEVNGVTITANQMTQTDVSGIYFERVDGNAGNCWVNKVLNCQLRDSSIKIESTDSYVSHSEIWGQSRSFAIHVVASSQQIDNCQIVGSSVNGGLYISDKRWNFDIEIIKVTNCYFDGSYTGVQSGWGVIAEHLRSSTFTNNTFWKQKEGGLKITNGYANNIVSNTFMDNSQNHTGAPDILIDGAINNNVIGNTFARYGSYPETTKGKSIDVVNTGTNPNYFVSNMKYNTASYDNTYINQTDIGMLNVGMSNTYHFSNNGAPTTGSRQVGQYSHNLQPIELGTTGSKYIIQGWICTVAGTPGTWKECRVLTGA